MFLQEPYFGADSCFEKRMGIGISGIVVAKRNCVQSLWHNFYGLNNGVKKIRHRAGLFFVFFDGLCLGGVPKFRIIW